MGCICTSPGSNTKSQKWFHAGDYKARPPPQNDRVHELPQSVRRELLVYAYMKKLEKHTEHSMPLDIKSLCSAYLEDTVIKSRTDIYKEEEKERIRLLPVRDEHKVCMLGYGAVGMTTIIHRLMRDEFLEEYDPTIEDVWRHPVVSDGAKCMLQILDTAGQEEFMSMQDHYIREHDAFILCYSIIDQPSFKRTKEDYQRIVHIKEDEDFVVVVCANKTDLEQHRKVSKQEGQDIAKQWDAPFIETSAKTGENVRELFETLVREKRQRYSISCDTRKS